MKRILLINIIIILMLIPMRLKAQALENIINFLTIQPNKKAVAKDSSIYPTKAILTPVISYAPETNLSLEVGVKGLLN